jgi:hypothetical protein
MITASGAMLLCNAGDSVCGDFCYNPSAGDICGSSMPTTGAPSVPPTLAPSTATPVPSTRPATLAPTSSPTSLVPTALGTTNSPQTTQSDSILAQGVASETPAATVSLSGENLARSEASRAVFFFGVVIAIISLLAM